MIRLIATGLYSGFLPTMPGTFGTLVGLLFWAAILMLGSLQATLITLGVIFIVGMFTTYLELKLHPDDPDPSYIVIDEIFGVGIPIIFSLYLFESIPAVLVSSFLTFRYFDILKVWPIYKVEEFFAKGTPLSKAFGVMIDDVLAGTMAMLLILAMHSLGLL